MIDNIKATFIDKFTGKIGDIITTIIGDGASFIEGLYPVFLITCIVGIFITMAGSEKKGKNLSSISFLLYLIARAVGSNV